MSTGGVWCVAYHRAEHRLDWVVDRAPYHRTVRALVIDHGDPRGYVQFPLPDGPLTADALRAQADARFGPVPAPRPRIAHAGTPRASVIVCTRNRPAEVEHCLSRLVRLDYPDFEIVVVDNAPSDDRTRKAVASFQGGAVDVRYVLEPIPGLSFARNRGIAAMRGQIAVYTDDDVSVDERWLAEVAAAFAADPSTGCVTGLVCTADIPTPLEAYFDSRAQNWSARMRPGRYSVAEHDLGSLFPYTPGEFGTGANFAFRREALEAMGGFDVVLGAGTATRGGEDTDAFVRVLLAGYGLTYSPRAIVWHHHRADETALRKQMFAWGVGLGSFVLAHLRQRATRRLVLRRTGSGLVQLVRTVKHAPDRSADYADVPRGLVALELLGMLLSPYYYLRARRDARARSGGPP